MSNRSASYFEAGEFVAALCDAEIVIQLKKGWSKGYFRKAKALVGLNDLPAARESIVEGLMFEPDNKASLVVSTSACVIADAGLRISSVHLRTLTKLWKPRLSQTHLLHQLQQTHNLYLFLWISCFRSLSDNVVQSWWSHLAFANV